MSKKRVKEKRRFDEFVTDGKIDLARIGNIVSLQSHYSAEEIKEHNRRLSAKYESIKCDIEKIVQTISDDLKQCNPLMIMLNVTDFSMMQLLHVVSESQLEMGHSNNLRLIEYIRNSKITRLGIF